MREIIILLKLCSVIMHARVVLGCETRMFNSSRTIVGPISGLPDLFTAITRVLAHTLFLIFRLRMTTNYVFYLCWFASFCLMTHCDR